MVLENTISHLDVNRTSSSFPPLTTSSHIPSPKKLPFSQPFSLHEFQYAKGEDFIAPERHVILEGSYSDDNKIEVNFRDEILVYWNKIIGCRELDNETQLVLGETNDDMSTLKAWSFPIYTSLSEPHLTRLDLDKSKGLYKGKTRGIDRTWYELSLKRDEMLREALKIFEKDKKNHGLERIVQTSLRFGGEDVFDFLFRHSSNVVTMEIKACKSLYR